MDIVQFLTIFSVPFRLYFNLFKNKLFGCFEGFDQILIEPEIDTLMKEVGISDQEIDNLQKINNSNVINVSFNVNFKPVNPSEEIVNPINEEHHSEIHSNKENVNDEINSNHYSKFQNTSISFNITPKK